VTKLETEAIVDAYLGKLDVALQQAAPRRRKELIDEIRDHISQGLREMSDKSAPAVLDLLDKLGRPEEIAAAAMAESGDRASRDGSVRSGARDGLTVALLLFGGFVFFVGWFVGVVLLWSSSTWRVRDNVLGTLLLPGGLVIPLLMVLGPGRNAFGSNCVRNIPAGGSPLNGCASTISPSWSGIALLVAAVIVPILVAIHLWRVALTSSQGSRLSVSLRNGMPAVPSR
jgi:hypothetical protein